MIRVLAGHDVSRYQAMQDWPLAETLLSFEALVLRRAMDDYRWAGAASLGGAEKPAMLRHAEERGLL